MHVPTWIYSCKLRFERLHYGYIPVHMWFAKICWIPLFTFSDLGERSFALLPTSSNEQQKGHQEKDEWTKETMGNLLYTTKKFI